MEDKIKELGKDMSPILLEDLGMKFPTENSKRRYRYGLYQCQYCGEEFETIQQQIKGGNTQSCGCHKLKIMKLQQELNITHGLSKHPLYKNWTSMKNRCLNVKYKYYGDYGGRGIQIKPMKDMSD